MSHGPNPTRVTLTTDERAKLTDWARRPTSAQRLALRSRIVLAAAAGHPNTAIATDLRVTLPTVRKWRDRFALRRLDGLADEPRPGCPRTITDEQVEAAVTQTLEAKPADATHWSTRSLARTLGLSQSAVVRIWHAFGLKPHRHETFKLSTDPFFVEKVRDIVGLYVAPPDRAIVLCVDEKSQIQALDRTQPGLPIKPGRCQTMTHDYKRHGTTTLFAALSVLDGTVIGRCMQRHRHREFIRFLNAVERQVATGKPIHVVLDNYATHKHPKVLAWLSRHPRWTFHFTPTSASWLNAVEGFFAKLTKRRLKRGVFCSIVDLQAAINRFLRETNDDPKPFVWTADPEKIIASVKRGYQALESIH